MMPDGYSVAITIIIYGMYSTVFRRADTITNRGTTPSYDALMKGILYMRARIIAIAS